jgi:hypothetical protein
VANPYAKVTIYTDSQQNVDGYLKLFNCTYESYDWNMNFHFDPSEGQAVDGGYMYQKWVPLTGFGFPYPVGELYYLEETAYGRVVESSSYSPQQWPQYLVLPAIDFRTQGGG